MSALGRLVRSRTAIPTILHAKHAKPFSTSSPTKCRYLASTPSTTVILASCTFLASAFSTSAYSLYNATPVRCEPRRAEQFGVASESHNDATKVETPPESSDENKALTAVKSTVNAILGYTWKKWVDGKWLVHGEPGNATSSGNDTMKAGRENATDASPGDQATPAAGTSITDAFASAVPSISSSQAFVAEKVNEIVNAIRAKVQTSSPDSRQETTNVTVQVVTDASTVPVSTERSPAQSQGTTRVRGTRVSQLVEELTQLLSEHLGIKETNQISIPDLSLTKVFESIQSSTISKKIDELTEAISSERAVLALSDIFLGENNILETIAKSQKNEELHPEIKWDAEVRIGRDLSQDELDFVRARRLVVCEALKRYLDLPPGVQVHEDDVPTIGVAGSGGGYRAMVSTIGSLIGLDNSGFLETSTYIGSVSGSTWAVAQLYSIPTKSSPSDHADTPERAAATSSSKFAPKSDPARALEAGSSSTTENLRLLVTHITDAIQCSPTSPHSIIHLIQNINPDFVLGGLISKQFAGGEISIVDAFGTLLGMRLLAPVAIAVIDAAKEGHENVAAEKGEAGEGDPINLVDVRFGLSKQKKSLENGERPMPVYTAVRHERPGVDHGQVDRWEMWEFTPYEIGSTEFGAFIPSWAFGRKFSGGHSMDRFPEPALSLLLGMFGSAFCANAAQVYDELRSKLPSWWINQADGIFAAFNVSVSELQPIPPSGWHNPFYSFPAEMLPKRLASMEPQRNKFAAKVTVEVKIDSQNEQGEKKRDAGKGRDDGNVVERKNSREDGTGKDGAGGEGGRIIFENSDEASKKEGAEDALLVEKEVHLMDAGLLNNLSVAPLIRPEREVDVLLVLDSSNDIATHDYLQRLAVYAKTLGRKVGLPEEMNWEGRGVKNVVVWDPEPEDEKTTKVQGEATSAKPRHRNPRDSEDHGCTVVYVPLLRNEEFDPDFDPQTAEFCSTFNFCYTPEETDKLIGLAKKNIEDAESSLKDVVRKSYERRRRQRIEREERETGLSMMLSSN